MGVTLLGGTPPRCLPHGILGNVAKHYGIWVPPLGVCPMAFWVMLQSIMGYGYPPPRCGQTENITFPILRMRAVKIIIARTTLYLLIATAMLRPKNHV